ncbi:hypothetical protein [Pseudanabaena yagii]|uniref:Isochorismatase-like domain-containing protein n=1 Tax=Pseudanabaena yagii GIHE-NHR1 TaxID=2722753 RepID=A0ABX1LSE4_9CYAN|nr:hypothetical protein [Pseudanabaena yagii]NMF59077.1 hypothetical protein [Pseudanabaena yagii GIHE-NHR1]
MLAVITSSDIQGDLQRFAALGITIACLQKSLISGDRMAEVSNIAARDDGFVISEWESITHLSLHDEQQFKVQNILMQF